MATYAVILAAAGKSTRFTKQKRKKPFVELKGRAVWLRTAEHFVARDDVVQTIIVIASDDVEWFKDKFRPNMAFMDIEIVVGGAERADSVANGLSAVKSDVDFVAVHDAARPLLAKAWIDKIFEAAKQHDAVIPAVQSVNTLKRVDENHTIEETVSRDRLWQAQTPQLFRRELLVEAFAKRGNFNPTDEAQLVERLGHDVHVIEGSPMNFKITTYDDFKMAEAVLGALPKPKSLGALHPFADEDPRLL